MNKVTTRTGLRRLLRSERGTAVVEFALVAPILFLLVFGIVEFGRVLNYYNDLTQLSGQGARAAVVNRNPDNSVVGTDPACSGGTGRSIQCQIATKYPTDKELRDGISVCLGTLNNSTGVITAPSAPLGVGAAVTVRTKFTYKFLTSFFGFASITLTSTHTERNEATPTWTGGNVGPGPTAGDACSP